ncbi:hypothetical protein ACFOKF_19525 [Sphingobium rhizovicinum]|uniref:Uncharacterized protein n=1 Tax=Sphingobium rhizovicinum TaxID=432308 RepID=A0ABV7NJL9_9SPHN
MPSGGVHPITNKPIGPLGGGRSGGQAYLDKGSDGFRRTFTRPPISLADLASEMATKLPSKSIRVVGRPDLMISRIVNIGHDIAGVLNAFAIGDVAICPEIREWDSIEYTRDVMATTGDKALILIAHERGEEDGMLLCRDWLQKLVPERKVTFIDSGEPFINIPSA